MAKRIYFSTIDKDVKRVLGKKLYKACENEFGFIVAIRSNDDAEYHLNDEASRKLKRYMMEHRKSRLYKAWTGDSGKNVRFVIDDWS